MLLIQRVLYLVAEVDFASAKEDVGAGLAPVVLTLHLGFGDGIDHLAIHIDFLGADAVALLQAGC